MTAQLSLSGTKRLSRTTQAHVVAYLRRAILLGELPPGTRLVQAELAELMHISVTPIREALRELSTQGLVDLDAFRGAVVHTPTLAELEDIFEVRAALLPLSIRQGVQCITPQQLEEAAAVLAQMEQEPDQTRWIELNRTFHDLLYSASNNHHLQTILQRLSDIATLYINLSFAEHPNQRRTAEAEHQAVLAAYQNQDADLATDLMLQHINSTLDAARDVLQSAASSET